MTKNDADVLVVGTGTAGLTEAAELAQRGRSVIILEARDRIGGRIFTWRDSRVDFPIELQRIPDLRGTAMNEFRSLGELLNVETAKIERLLEDGYFHDWQQDPYFRGVYSYAKAGSEDAPKIPGRPVQDMPFFAGEATDDSGNNGTAHRAIAADDELLMKLNKAAKNQIDSRRRLRIPHIFFSCVSFIS